MGSVGNSSLYQYPDFPAKTRYSKYEDTWYFEDATKDKFAPDADTGYTIQRVYTGGYHGRGTGSTTASYEVSYKMEPLASHHFRTLKEAKNYLEQQEWRK